MRTSLTTPDYERTNVIYERCFAITPFYSFVHLCAFPLRQQLQYECPRRRPIIIMRDTSNLCSHDLTLSSNASYPYVRPAYSDLVATTLLLEQRTTVGSLPHAHVAWLNKSTFFLVHKKSSRPCDKFDLPYFRRLTNQQITTIHGVLPTNKTLFSCARAPINYTPR